jgi:cellulose synthase/poly-beta-1,6-N-acetylglucosamine synthase-like glycosyltransferase
VPDFQAEAIATCLNQDYPDFHVFLLDDSTRPEFRAAVEGFHAQHPERTTLIRRATRQGFKAGNLNHALRGEAAAYPYFAVVDADERLPADFLRRTVPHLQSSDVAFAQANHAPNPTQHSAFARQMGPTILPFWQVHCKPRNRFGFVIFLAVC